MIYLPSNTLWFPNVNQSRSDGLLAIGGDLSPRRLILAYKSGIFPWYDDNQPILWWSPDPRMVLFPKAMKVSKSLKKAIKNEEFQVTFNQAFTEVMRNCSKVKRKDQAGTWITQDMIDAYLELHRMGYAFSVEVWKDEKLVGGLYGINLKKNKIFCGESMFSLESNASKVGLYHLVQYLEEENYKLIDCQMYTPHLESLGATEIPREEFLAILNDPKS